MSEKVYTFEMIAHVSVSAESEGKARELLVKCTATDEDTDINGCGVYIPFTPNQDCKCIDVWSEDDAIDPTDP